MTKISKFGEEFLLLALRIDKHLEGYVDFYYGPEKFRQIVDGESLTAPKMLLDASNDLFKKLESQGFDKDRTRYIKKLLIAMKTFIVILIGSSISVKAQISRLYDVTLQPVNDSKLYALKEELHDAYGRSGSLEERMKELRIRRKVATT